MGQGWPASASFVGLVPDNDSQCHPNLPLKTIWGEPDEPRGCQAAWVPLMGHPVQARGAARGNLPETATGGRLPRTGGVSLGNAYFIKCINLALAEAFGALLSLFPAIQVLMEGGLLESQALAGSSGG